MCVHTALYEYTCRLGTVKIINSIIMGHETTPHVLPLWAFLH